VIEDILSMFLALIGIVCVILLTYYASKWYARKMGTIAGGKHIRIVDRLMISKTGSVLIIDIEGTQYLIGANDHSIQIMKELAEPIDLLSAENVAEGGAFKSFKSYLHKGKDND